MYAVITTWTVPQRIEQARYRQARASVVPDAAHAPGFVAGYSTVAHVDGRSYEFAVFNSEAAARTFMRLVGRDRPALVEHGVQRHEVTLVEMTAVVRPQASNEPAEAATVAAPVRHTGRIRAEPT